MEEFFLWLVGVIAEVLVEAFFEYIMAMVVDALLRISDSISAYLVSKPRITNFLVLGLLGLSIGLLSIPIFPHRLWAPSRLHGINLLISPVLTGLMLSWTGAALRKREKETTPIQRFGYGFIFAFGIALMRLLFAR